MNNIILVGIDFMTFYSTSKGSLPSGGTLTLVSIIRVHELLSAAALIISTAFPRPVGNSKAVLYLSPTITLAIEILSGYCFRFRNVKDRAYVSSF